MADKNFNPNARYDNGANAAGSGRASAQATLVAATTKGLGTDGVLGNANLKVGQGAAGMSRNNPGPNVAGAARAYGVITNYFSGTNPG